jgi:hypothetical protein
MSETVTPATILTIHLPSITEAPATLLIQHGELAHLRQFAYSDAAGLGVVIAQGMEALELVEANPPVIPEAPKAEPKPTAPRKPAAKAAPAPAEDAKLTLDIPLRKGVRKIAASLLHLPDDEAERAAALALAGRLIDGKLWDASMPIRICDVEDATRKLRYLSDKELALFTLEEFAEVLATESAV